MDFMVLENQHKTEDFASFHFQNTLIDYDINILPPPPDKNEIKLGVSSVICEDGSGWQKVIYL